MLNCQEVTELCSQELERPLRMGEHLSLRMHLMMCTGCTNFRSQMHLLRKATHAYSSGEADLEPDKDGSGR
jgi:hypothetical protein